MKRLIILVLVICVLICGCNYLPSPYEVIRPPLGKNIEDINLDITLTDFIPVNMILLSSENSGGQYKTRFTDIENDGLGELVIFYGMPKSNECKGVVILKNEDEKWTEFYTQSFTDDTRYSIENVMFIDITHDGYRELIIRLSTLNNVRMASIYTFKGAIRKLYTLGANRLEIIYNEETAPALAIWNEEFSGIYSIEIIRWEKQGFVNATYDYPGFFLQLLPGYERNVMEDPEDMASLLLYADVLMKSGDYKNSLEQVDNYLSLSSDTLDANIANALFIKGRCHYSLGEMENSKEALDRAVSVMDSEVEIILASKLLLVDIYYLQKEYDLAEKELNECEDLLYFFITSNYKAHIWKSAYESKNKLLGISY